MFKCKRPEMPKRFAQIQSTGMSWLANHPTGAIPNRWYKYRMVLGSRSDWACAYAAIYTREGTVDHFISQDEDRGKAYDWTNYRYACSLVNSSKQNLPSSSLIDPFDVQNGWFEIMLPSLELIPTNKIPHHLRPKAQYMLDRLPLGRDERIIKYRESIYEPFIEGQADLSFVRQRAPLIAQAVYKRLRGTGKVYAHPTYRLFLQGQATIKELARADRTIATQILALLKRKIS